MRELFAEVPQIGKLYYHHIYLFYDGPQIFSCLTPTFQAYFIVAIPSEKGEAWLCAPISPGKLSKLEGNTVEIRDALIQPESLLWKIEAAGTNWAAELVEPSSLTEDLLPEKGEFLDYSENTELRVSDESPLAQAKQEMRDIIEISFEKDDTHMREISCVALGELLNNTQQLVYAIANKNGGLKGPIPKKIREDCTLCVSSMFAASVGVRLKSDKYCGLDFETPLTRTLREFNQLFSVANNKGQLKNFLMTQSPRVATRYRALVQSLLAYNTGIRINNASPDESYFAKHFTTKELLENFGLINSQIKDWVEHSTLYGTLVGVNVERNTFEFISVDDEKIKGSIAAPLYNNTFSIPQEVEIEVEIRIGIDSITREEKPIYQLTGIGQHNSE